MIKIKKESPKIAEAQPEREAPQAGEADGRPENKEKGGRGIGRLLPSRRPVASPQREERRSAAPAAEGKPTTGWHSPNYSVSRLVELAPATVAANRCILHHPPDSAETDAYRMLRTQILQRCNEKGGNTLMVTSAVAGEGKSLTALNLAVTLAQEFSHTVLLVDCDLRQQMIHRYLGYQSERGLIDHLFHGAPLSDLITWPGIEKLTVISGGRPITGSSELLGSPQMRELVEEMKSRYPERYVIFDVPPLLAGADALAFVPLVDHIVFTVQEGETSIHNVKKALQMVPAKKVLGLVLNRQKSPTDATRYPARPVAA